MNTLAAEATKYAAAKAALLEAYPDLADDEETLRDTLEGINDLPDLLTAVMREVDEAEMLAAALKAREAELKGRRDRLAVKADKLKSAVMSAMRAAGERKMTLPEWTISVCAKRASVVITDEKAVPSAYWVETVERRIDKNALKEGIDVAAKKGRSIPGATLSNGGETLSVRRK